ncbi:hypothetical protein BCR36DRAFT_373344 [Piromyces finnis]|uniref:Uncharacterized protein n=1 Tax=Piromyces finnis TaxID=1754191 RepID=A0A1Y1V106_9FUNG|nr:hypothetical protein BCR36DRAFT_373344 [Piromyces finnis]|eukprot:ORX44328.1 hypothetical protein BCR36DRAFT_373344 [Piromyces finnis]
MKIKNIIPYVILLNRTSLANIILPSGKEVPKSLLHYFSCQTGNTVCINGNGRSCHYEYISYCESPDIQIEKISKDFDIGNFPPSDFCKLINESCQYINIYVPEISDNDVYDLDQYLSCGYNDSICQYGNYNGCKKVLDKCWGKYPVKDCRNLSETCDNIYKQYNDEVAIFTPDNTRLPKPLTQYFGCLLGDISCKREETKKCLDHYTICNPERQSELIEYINNNDEIDYLEPNDYCDKHKKACEYIMEYNNSFNSRYIYDLEIYECEINTQSCYYGKRSSCRMAYSMCESKYPNDACNKLLSKCNEIDQLYQSYNLLYTPSGAEVPQPLLKYFDIENGETAAKSCLQEYSLYCENRDQTKYINLLSNYDIGDLNYLEFCFVIKEFCGMLNSTSEKESINTFTKKTTLNTSKWQIKTKKLTTKLQTITKKPTITRWQAITKKLTTTRRSFTANKYYSKLFSSKTTSSSKISFTQSSTYLKKRPNYY